MGAQNITTRFNMQLSTLDLRRKMVRWFPIDEGNASFSGCWKLSQEGEGTRVHFENEGHIELPLPRLAKTGQTVCTGQISGAFWDLCFNLKKTFSALS